ncbi:MAG: hypothetical protein NT072_06745 [Deltaproteobacteria bacterium]|nr:hypothetical protein [Deltaproteobacteria bacterium]
MNSSERIAAAMALDCPDRVPLAPLLDHWAATYTGITNAILMTDPGRRFDAVLKTAVDFRWDMTYLADTANATLLRIGVPARLRMPGVDLPENSIHQFEETGFMKDEDFDILETGGLFALFSSLIPRIYPDITLESALLDIDRAAGEISYQAGRLREAGIEPAVGFVIPGPSFEYFCFARSINTGLMDIRRRPDKLKAAGKRYCEDILEIAVGTILQNDIRRVFIGLSRSSPVFLTARHFEDLILPELEFLVHGLINAGINPVLHCDTDWTKFLHYFRRFPKGKCILELDSFTDIFKAKEILGDCMAIMGDVPSTLLAKGTKDEVLEYCRILIEKIGAGGGFILSSGCSIPANARTENIQAMTDAVEEWGRY